MPGILTVYKQSRILYPSHLLYNTLSFGTYCSCEIQIKIVYGSVKK